MAAGSAARSTSSARARSVSNSTRPPPLEVIADGTSVAVRDKKLLTQDMYFIQQTPLKFLLREKVDLGGDIAITGISNEPNAVRLDPRGQSTLGGTSRITLFFDPEMKNLTQWRIVDPQGFQTVLTLNKVDRGKPIDQSLFRIPNAPNIPAPSATGIVASRPSTEATLALPSRAELS